MDDGTNTPGIKPANTHDIAETGEISPRQSLSKAWWGVVMLSLLYAFSILDRQIISLLVTDIRADLGITDFQLGLVTGISFAAFYISFGLLFGWLVDRYPRRLIIFFGVNIWSIAAVFCGLVRNFGQLAVARFGLGAGEAALNPAAYSLISDSFPRNRISLALSVFSVGAHIGTAISILCGGLLIALIPSDGVSLPLLGHLAPWRATFVIIGVPGLLIAWIIWTVYEPARRAGPTFERGDRAGALRFMRSNWKLFAGQFLGFGLLVAAAYSWTAWIPVFLHRQYRLPITQIALILSATSLIGGIVGTIVAGYCADRWFPKRSDIHLLLAVLLCVGQLIFSVLAVASGSIDCFIIGAFGFSLMTGYGSLSVAPLQLVTPSRYRGQVSAVFLFVFNLMGMGVGPTLTGAFTSFLFADDTKVGWAVVCSCAIMLPTAILVLLAIRPRMRAAIAIAQGMPA